MPLSDRLEIEEQQPMRERESKASIGSPSTPFAKYSVRGFNIRAYVLHPFLLRPGDQAHPLLNHDWIPWQSNATCCGHESKDARQRKPELG